MEVNIYSEYSESAGKDTTRVALGKRITQDLWVQVSSSLGEDGIKVVLLGETMLLASVQQLLPSAHLTFELKPLAADQVADYVSFKLACAGYQGKFPLDIDVMTVIEARSQGIPGAINVMVKDELGVAIAHPIATKSAFGSGLP